MSARADHWELRTTSLALTRRPLVMGIVNVTPDSFSEGGIHADADAAVAHALHLVDSGADMLDIGGESTRPNAHQVPAAEELDRVMPVIEALVDRVEVPLSLDTSKAEVARAGIEAGVQIINDVTGFEGDPAMTPLAAETDVAVCIMHMQGTPATMQVDPHYDDVVEDVARYLDERRRALIDAGVDAGRICLDPGIGFGKTLAHNVALMRNVGRIAEIGAPVLYGHSRKGFIGALLGDVTVDRDAATIGATLALVAQGVDVVRVHDVAGTVRALRLFGTITDG